MRSNMYKRGYYPCFEGSVCKCLRGIFKIHNETGNIWTHLVCVLIFVPVFALHFAHGLPSNPDTQPLDYLPWAVFCGTAVYLVCASTAFHVFTTYSEAAYRFTLTLDYVGIAACCYGNMTIATYYTTFCNARLRIVCLVLMTTFGAVATYVLVTPEFFAPQFRKFRTVLITAFGCCGGIPVVYFLVRFSSTPCREVAFAMLWTIVPYFSAMLAYVFQFPERQAAPQGRFDIWPHSHQLMHIGVSTGIWLAYQSMLKAHNLVRGGPFACDSA